MELSRVVFALLILVATVGLIPLLRPVAKRLFLVDHPSDRKQHGEPVPLIGGIVMGLVVLPGIVGLQLFAPFPVLPRVWISLTVALAMLVIGVFDDYRNIRPTTRLIAQIGAALVLAIPAGYQVTTLGALGDLGPWSLPFTVLVMVTFMNACNMVDGADGLLGCALLPMFAALSIVCLQPLNWGTAMMGALVFGFLFFNWPGHHYREKRRRIFLGNGGVMFVATMSVGMLVRSVDSPDSPLTPGSAPWLTMIPLLELATSVVRRSMKKVSPIHSDRDHIHHRLLEQGVTPVTLAVGYLVFSTLCSAIAVVGPLAGVPDVLMWAGAATVLTIAAALEFWRAIRSVRSVSGLQDAQDGGDAREG